MSTSNSSLQLDSSAQEAPAWKDEINARLAAHRTRRAGSADGQPQRADASNTVSHQESPAARVAARVAERYSNAPTYSEMLAVEAANAARAAEAAAQAAQQAHLAAQAIFAELELSAAAEARQEARASQGEPAEPAPSQQFFAAYHQPLPQHPSALERGPGARHPLGLSAVSIVDPFEEATVPAAQPLLAKLIEFPRELIATRKARPRLAEGPLREPAAEPERSQLRIFEVEPEPVSIEAPAAALPATLPEWHSIRLSARPEQAHDPVTRSSDRSVEDVCPGPQFELPLQIAPIEDRVMAAAVDGALIVAAFLLFVLVFASCATLPPSGKAVIAGAGAALAALILAYQWLFFSYADATPGMRYAKIALCTFEDENPSRHAMRGRIGAMLLAALPLGLGFAWAFFDDDRLGWHDRMSRTYQRSYR